MFDFKVVHLCEVPPSSNRDIEVLEQRIRHQARAAADHGIGLVESMPFDDSALGWRVLAKVNRRAGSALSVYKVLDIASMHYAGLNDFLVVESTSEDRPDFKSLEHKRLVIKYQGKTLLRQVVFYEDEPILRSSFLVQNHFTLHAILHNQTYIQGDDLAKVQVLGIVISVVPALERPNFTGKGILYPIENTSSDPKMLGYRTFITQDSFSSPFASEGDTVYAVAANLGSRMEHNTALVIAKMYGSYLLKRFEVGREADKNGCFQAYLAHISPEICTSGIEGRKLKYDPTQHEIAAFAKFSAPNKIVSSSHGANA